MVKAFQCPHLLCYKCADDYFDQKMKNHKKFNCPSCDAIMDENSAYANSLGMEVQRKLANIHFRSHILKNPKRKLCPDEKCEDGYLMFNPSQKKGRCLVCYK